MKLKAVRPLVIPEAAPVTRATPGNSVIVANFRRAEMNWGKWQTKNLRVLTSV